MCLAHRPKICMGEGQAPKSKAWKYQAKAFKLWLGKRELQRDSRCTTPEPD